MSLNGLCKCACARLLQQANFNLISKTNLFMPVLKVFQISFKISFQILQDKKYGNLLGVRSKLLLSIVYRLIFSLTDSNIGYVHVFAGSQVRRPISYLQITNIFLFRCTSLSRLFPSYRDEPIGRWGEKIVPRENHLSHPQTELGLFHM